MDNIISKYFGSLNIDKRMDEYKDIISSKNNVDILVLTKNSIFIKDISNNEQKYDSDVQNIMKEIIKRLLSSSNDLREFLNNMTINDDNKILKILSSNEYVEKIYNVDRLLFYKMMKAEFVDIFDLPYNVLSNFANKKTSSKKNDDVNNHDDDDYCDDCGEHFDDCCCSDDDFEGCYYCGDYEDCICENICEECNQQRDICKCNGRCNGCLRVIMCNCEKVKPKKGQSTKLLSIIVDDNLEKYMKDVEQNIMKYVNDTFTKDYLVKIINDAQKIYKIINLKKKGVLTDEIYFNAIFSLNSNDLLIFFEKLKTRLEHAYDYCSETEEDEYLPSMYYLSDRAFEEKIFMYRDFDMIKEYMAKNFKFSQHDIARKILSTYDDNMTTFCNNILKFSEISPKFGASLLMQLTKQKELTHKSKGKKKLSPVITKVSNKNSKKSPLNNTNDNYKTKNNKKKYTFEEKLFLVCNSEIRKNGKSEEIIKSIIPNILPNDLTKLKLEFLDVFDMWNLLNEQQLMLLISKNSERLHQLRIPFGIKKKYILSVEPNEYVYLILQTMKNNPSLFTESESTDLLKKIDIKLLIPVINEECKTYSSNFEDLLKFLIGLFPELYELLMKNKINLTEKKLSHLQSQLIDKEKTLNEKVLSVLLERDNSNKFTCGLCTVNQVSEIFKDCFHMVCQECNDKINETNKKCPYCNKKCNSAHLFSS